MNILVLNGPNLNLLGKRNPEKYGTETLNDVLANITRAAHVIGGIQLEAHQSNHEGQLIDWIQQAVLDPKERFEGIILNAGGLTHSSIALRDAVEFARDLGTPTVEVHLSDIHKRDTFRHVSFLTEVCIGQICGKKGQGYCEALEVLVEHVRAKQR